MRTCLALNIIIANMRQAVSCCICQDASKFLIHICHKINLKEDLYLLFILSLSYHGNKRSENFLFTTCETKHVTTFTSPIEITTMLTHGTSATDMFL